MAIKNIMMSAKDNKEMTIIGIMLTIFGLLGILGIFKVFGSSYDLFLIVFNMIMMFLMGIAFLIQSLYFKMILKKTVDLNDDENEIRVYDAKVTDYRIVQVVELQKKP